MLPELGQIALILALLMSILQGVLPLVGAWRKSPALMAVGRPAAVGQFLFVALAFGILAYAFLTFNFSVEYVANNSNLALPWYYRFAAVWGAHEGSMLLWMLILNVWTLSLAIFSPRLPEDFGARVLGVLGLLSVGFLLFILLTSNPFGRLLPAPADGADLNPVLQDPGMTFHPPVLYMGYVGFSVAFAFSIAALLGGGVDKQWVRWARPWTNLAWGFLTLGIVAGSWWAYAELGWGGWWFWDPVENASFMPWLVGTALIHSQAITEKRGTLPAWTVLLSIFAFSLSLLGTFLVRSGVLTSVHSFASDPRRGVFILIYLGIVIGSSLLLYALRAPKVAGGKPFAPLSRETLLLIVNLLLTTSAAMVLLGTLFPLIGDAFGWGRISVGPPYFGTLFILLMAPAIVLMPLGPFARWGRAGGRLLVKVFVQAAIVAVLLGGILFAAEYSGVPPWRAILGGLASIYVIYGVVAYAIRRWREAPAGNRYPAEMLGMLIAHLGVGIFLAGVLLTTALSVEHDVRLAPGQTETIGAFAFRFKGIKHTEGPNWKADQGTVEVLENGKPLTVLHPQKRTYERGQVQTESDIDAGPLRDLYVAMGEPLDNGAWALRIYVKPFIRWLWGGGVLMMLGGFVAASDRRFRLKRNASGSAATTATLDPASVRGMNRILPLLGFALLVGLFGFGIWWNTLHDQREVPSPLIGKPAPAYNLPLLDDPSTTVSKHEMLGQPYLINVFASWCFACGEEHPVLMQEAQQLGIPLVGYDYKDQPSDAKAWLDKHGNPYSMVVTDQSGDTAINFGIYGAPETFLIDANGVIRYKHIGPLTPNVIKTVLEPKIAKLKRGER
jgi:cytochrome c-type biogenesis protein CcmF